MKREATALLAVAALQVFFVAGLPALLISSAAHDDALYLRSAEHLAAGEWLGPYDNRTLARGPFYPAFIAAMFRLGVPLRLAQSLAYLVSGALLLLAVRPWMRPAWLRVATFAAYAFDPMSYQLDMLRVVREGVYVPLTVLVLALAAWLLRLRDSALPSRLVIAATLGLALGALWLTREEGPWILPALLGAAAVGTLRQHPCAQPRVLARDAGVAATAGLVALACVETVCLLNSRRYDTWCATEFRQDAFPRAYGALLRLEPRSRKPFVPVTRDALHRAAGAGLMTAEAVGRLDAGLAGAWAGTGCEVHGVRPCDGEVRGGWFMFALRDAAAEAGHYVSGGEAEAFYRRMAEEIDAACEAGRLECGPPRHGFVPPFGPAELAAAAGGALRGVAQLVTFEGFELRPGTSLGSDVDHARHARLVGARVFPLAGAAGPPPELPDRIRFRLLPLVAETYRWLTPPLVGLALLAFAARLRSAPLAPSSLVAGMLLVAVVTRLLLVTFIAATSMLIQTRYLSPAYPLLLLFTGLSLAGLARGRKA